MVGGGGTLIACLTSLFNGNGTPFTINPYIKARRNVNGTPFTINPYIKGRRNVNETPFTNQSFEEVLLYTEGEKTHNRTSNKHGTAYNQSLRYHGTHT